MKVLNLGEVELVDHMGSDASVVQAARISNGAVMPDWRGAPDEKLIKYLGDHEHMTPFEHATFKFYVKAPIFVVREWQRHRTFSYNEMSGRYKELKPEFYYPPEPRMPDPNNKQSSVVSMEPFLGEFMENYLREAYDAAWVSYQAMLRGGIAREIARSVLPVGIYSEMYVTGNFRNWMHWFNLRSHPNAQWEIQEYARCIGNDLRDLMPLSFEALVTKS